MSSLPYFKIPESPTTCSSSSILIRVIDALGFRYYWATEGLEEFEYDFRPSQDSMNMKELLQHIRDHVYAIDASFGGKKEEKDVDLTPNEIRRDTLERIYKSRNRLKQMTNSRLNECMFYNSYYDKEFPIWNIINGPLCDALTHVGQLNSWRRLEGNPVHGANVFLGEPPI